MADALPVRPVLGKSYREALPVTTPTAFAPLPAEPAQAAKDLPRSPADTPAPRLAAWLAVSCVAHSKQTFPRDGIMIPAMTTDGVAVAHRHNDQPSQPRHSRPGPIASPAAGCLRRACEVLRRFNGDAHRLLLVYGLYRRRLPALPLASYGPNRRMLSRVHCSTASSPSQKPTLVRGTAK
eukprot:s1185_g10.t1